MELTFLSSQFLNLVFLTYRLWNLTKVISLFLMPRLTFFVMISHLMSPSPILLEEPLSKVRRHLSKQSNVHFSHFTPDKDTTVANYTYTVINTKNAKGHQWQESDLRTTFCVCTHAHFTSMTTSRTELQCLQKLQIWKQLVILSITKSCG